MAVVAADPEKTPGTGTYPRHEGAESSSSDTDNVPSPPKDEFVPPDGGLVAWSQVLAGNLVNCMSWGIPGAFGVYQLHYRETLGISESQISWIGSLQVFLTFFMCTVSGRLADAGYARHIIAAGSVLAILGIFMTSLATRYWQIILAQGVCTGLGLGLMFMAPVSVINSYFRRKRAMVMAISATGTGFGGVIFPSMVQYLDPKIGFPWAVRCSGFVVIFIAALAVALIRPRLEPRRSGSLIEWAAFKEPPYLLYTVGTFMYFLALYFGYFYINTYARNVIGFSARSSIQLLLITNGMSVPSRPITGFLADRYLGPINTFIMGFLVLSGMLFAWIGVRTRTGMYVFAVFFGLVNGAAQGLFIGSLASLTKDPRKMGTRTGMVCTIFAFATLAGPPLAGAIIDGDGGRYRWAQVWAGLVIAVAAVLVSTARWSTTGWKLWVKI